VFQGGRNDRRGRRNAAFAIAGEEHFEMAKLFILGENFGAAFFQFVRDLRRIAFHRKIEIAQRSAGDEVANSSARQIDVESSAAESSCTRNITARCSARAGFPAKTYSLALRSFCFRMSALTAAEAPAMIVPGLPRYARG